MDRLPEPEGYIETHIEGVNWQDLQSRSLAAARRLSGKGFSVRNIDISAKEVAPGLLSGDATIYYYSVND